jgi:hypothetical protein
MKELSHPHDGLANKETSLEYLETLLRYLSATAENPPAFEQFLSLIP